MGDKIYSYKDMIIELLKDNNKKFKSDAGCIYYVKDNILMFNDKVCSDRINHIFNNANYGYEYREVKRHYKDRIKKGDTYYVIKIGLTHTDYMIREFIYNEDWQDRKMIERCNFFETEEEAQEKLNKILEVLKGDK